jgi:excisionase family DNA binding protein
MENFLTVRDVAGLVNLSELTIRRYVMKKQIPYHKIFRSVRFKPSEINKWIEEKKEEMAGKKKMVQAAVLFDEAGGNAAVGGKA